MKKTTFKMYREENEKVILDLEVKRENDVFHIIEKVKDIDMKNLNKEDLNKKFQTIGLTEGEQLQMTTQIDGEEIGIEINDDLLDEFVDFFEFIDEVVENIKEIGGE